MVLEWAALSSWWTRKLRPAGRVDLVGLWLGLGMKSNMAELSWGLGESEFPCWSRADGRGESPCGRWPRVISSHRLGLDNGLAREVGGRGELPDADSSREFDGDGRDEDVLRVRLGIELIGCFRRLYPCPTVLDGCERV